MKKLYIIEKIVISIMLISIILAPTYVQASTIGNVISEGDSFINAGGNAPSPVNGDQVDEVIKSIYNIFLGAAIVVAVVAATYLGIQYMISSAIDKAKVKESFLALALGCVVAFGAFGIWRVFTTMLGTI